MKLDPFGITHPDCKRRFTASYYLLSTELISNYLLFYAMPNRNWALKLKKNEDSSFVSRFPVAKLDTTFAEKFIKINCKLYILAI